MKILIESLLKENKIDYPEGSPELFATYYEMLTETNKTLNLTRITEKSDVAVKHFLDSAASIKYLPYGCSLIDIGAGAGFPSLPIKILRPDISVVMLDSLNKRVKFLESVIKELGLVNIRALHMRAEEGAHNSELREKFDFALARAVASLPTLSELALPFVKIGGSFIAYKSIMAEEEIEQAHCAISALGGEYREFIDYALSEDLRHRLIFINKKISTPHKYPRGKNLPKTSPLK